MTTSDREYQRQLIAAIDAELGVLRWSRRHLAERAGITAQTMDRVFLLRRDMNVQQFDAIATALGVTPEYLVAQAKEWRDRPRAVEEIIDGAKELTERQKQGLKDIARTNRMAPSDNSPNALPSRRDASSGGGPHS